MSTAIFTETKSMEWYSPEYKYPCEGGVIAIVRVAPNQHVVKPLVYVDLEWHFISEVDGELTTLSTSDIIAWRYPTPTPIDEIVKASNDLY